jgi:hypothetical protein
MPPQKTTIFIAKTENPTGSSLPRDIKGRKEQE